jgi:hypothetical protein
MNRKSKRQMATDNLVRLTTYFHLTSPQLPGAH